MDVVNKTKFSHSFASTPVGRGDSKFSPFVNNLISYVERERARQDCSAKGAKPDPLANFGK